jgi:hypothetical protein
MELDLFTVLQRSRWEVPQSWIKSVSVLLQRFICHHAFRMGPQECRPCLCRFPLVSSPKGIEAVE